MSSVSIVTQDSLGFARLVLVLSWKVHGIDPQARRKQRGVDGVSASFSPSPTAGVKRGSQDMRRETYRNIVTSAILDLFDLAGPMKSNDKTRDKKK